MNYPHPFFELISDVIHTYIYTLLMLPKWAFQLNKLFYQLSMFGTVFCNALLPYFIQDVASRAIFQEPM